MKNLREKTFYLGCIIAVMAVILTIGFIKYKIWRAEHPETKTWIFFIPSRK